LTQAALAEAAGISRQTLSAIEAERSEPSVALAMRLARTLARSVEQLFGQPADAALEATLVEWPGARRRPATARRVVLAFIQERWVAHALELARHEAPTQPAHGIASPGRSQHVTVQLLQPLADARESIVLCGCAPVLGLLAQRLNGQRGPGRFIWLERSSTAALRALERAQIHCAGVHLGDPRTGERNIAAVRRWVPNTDLRLVTLVEWQAGLVMRKGNPLGIRGAADLGRAKLRIVAREPGAGARQLLEQQLRAAGLSHQRILERAVLVHGHFDVARAVALGAADAGVAMESAALAYDLDFLPLADERFDLVLADSAFDDPRLARLLDRVSSASFRRELSSLGGYRAENCGTVAAELPACHLGAR
jgi:putative molybdopterin biosynthesis protein